VSFVRTTTIDLFRRLSIIIDVVIVFIIIIVIIIVFVVSFITLKAKQ